MSVVKNVYYLCARVSVTVRIQRTGVEVNAGRFTPFFSADADHFNHVSSSRSKAFKAVKPANTHTILLSFNSHKIEKG